MARHENLWVNSGDSEFPLVINSTVLMVLWLRKQYDCIVTSFLPFIPLEMLEENWFATFLYRSRCGAAFPWHSVPE
jgi:hypothetical protein